MNRNWRGMLAVRNITSLVAAAMLLAACTNPFVSQPVQQGRTATLARGTLVATVNATGNIQPEAEVRLSFLNVGKITAVNVTRGDVVKKGDVLAQLDTIELDTALAQAQAALVVATANVSRTLEGPRQADITAAQAALNAANANYAKLRAGADNADIAAAETAVRNAEVALRQAQTADDLAYQFNPQNYPSSPTIVQLEQARNNYEASKLQYDKVARGADKAQLALAFQQVQDAKARLDRAQQTARPYEIEQVNAERTRAELQVRAAQRRLEQTTIVAPRDGVIAAVNIRAGEQTGATPGQPPIILVDTSLLHLNITVDEIDVSRVRVGQEVAVTLDALSGVEVKGTVDRVASTSALVSGVVSYLVRVVIEPTDAPLRVGMTANTSVVLDKREGVLLAPNWAIRRDTQTNQSFMYLRVDDETTEEVVVQIGLRNDSFSEILSGVSEGQVVVAPQAPNLLGQ